MTTTTAHNWRAQVASLTVLFALAPQGAGAQEAAFNISQALGPLAVAEPANPALPQPNRGLESLQAQPVDPLAAAVQPPAAIGHLLNAMRERLRQAEGALLSRDPVRAATLLDAVEAELSELRRTRAGEIPQAHVAAFVLEERIAVLKRQLSAKAAAGEPVQR